MFQSARIHLTGWYLLLIMGISILFSVAFYGAATSEIQRVIRVQEFREQHPGEDMIRPIPFVIRISPPRIQDMEEAAERLKWTLIFINAGIFVLAGGGGYFLAGRTLRPIQEMVVDQDRFITDASHELRTPLTSIRTEIEVGLRDKDLSLPEAKSLLESNLEEVISLQLLSDSLLQLSQAKPQRKSYEAIDVSEFVQKAIKQVQPLAREKQIAISYSQKEGKVRGDEISLIQLFVSLLHNAIKYSPAKTKVTILQKKTDHSIVLSVRDQGVGIAKEDIPNVFNRFFRGDKSRSKQSGGYGLGLAIAKKIVENHQGSITIDASVEKGTMIIVRLPSASQKTS